MKTRRTFSRRSRRCVVPACIGLALAARLTASACGPWLPNTILDHPDDVLAAMPEGNFAAEISALRAERVAGGAIARTNWPVSAFADTDPMTETALADEADLDAALAVRPLPAGQQDERACSYAVFRICLSQMVLLRAGTSLTDPLFAAGREIVLEPPAGLPKEFDLYARGAVAYHRGDLTAARRHWLELLTLPPAERRYRSTWSAYMLGRTWETEEPDRAAECFRLVRTLAAASFQDSLGLAAASLGREARIAFTRGRLEEAARLYLEQYAAGERGALISLEWTAHRLFEAYGHRLDQFARDPVLQRIATAWLVSRGEPWLRPSDEDCTRWLAAVRAAGVGEMAGADRMAWLAYRNGDMDAAREWLTHAPASSITARWVSAKLLMRQGRPRDAQALLDAVIRDTDAAAPDALPSYAATDQYAGDRPGSRPAGELAALLMTDGRYVEALDLLWRHGWWTDAAYVAERVLSAEELRRYVDEHCPPETTPVDWGTVERFAWDAYRHRTDQDWCRSALRYLLARRMARAGEFEASLAYYPQPWRDRMNEYRQRLLTGRDAAAAEPARAAALWRAAQIARYWGMELLGTEVNPDWYLYDGQFQLDYVAARMPTNASDRASVGSDEVQRVTAHVPRPARRFHYRYVAADLAWEAARLMPDNSPLTAWVLCQAGLWIKDRDALAADRFYKAIVRRCGATDLGREAAARRWFPKVDPMDHAWSGR